MTPWTTGGADQPRLRTWTTDCRRLAVGSCRRSPLAQQATLACTGNLLASLCTVWVAVQRPLTHVGGLCACVTSDNGPSQCLDRRAAATGSCRRPSRERSIGQPHTAPPRPPCSSRWLRPTAPARVQNWLNPLIKIRVVVRRPPAHAGNLRTCEASTGPFHHYLGHRMAAAGPRWRSLCARNDTNPRTTVWATVHRPLIPAGDCRTRATLADAPYHHGLGRRVAVAGLGQRPLHEQHPPTPLVIIITAISIIIIVWAAVWRPLAWVGGLHTCVPTPPPGSSCGGC